MSRKKGMIEPSERADALHGRDPAGLVADVECQSQRLGALLAKRRGNALGAGDVAVGQDQPHDAARAEPPRGRGADARGRAGDQRDGIALEGDAPVSLRHGPAHSRRARSTGT
jgi:hypothetical protein